MSNDLLDHFFGEKSTAFALRIVLVPALPLNMFKKHFSKIEKNFNGRPFYSGFTGKYNGERISVLSTGVGATVVGDAVLALKTVATHFLLANVAGTLSPELQIGDHFIPLRAIDGEGFSRYQQGTHADVLLSTRGIEMSPTVRAFCSSLQVPHGTVYTLGSLHAEQDRTFLELLKNKGIAAVDLETSAVYAAARTIEATALAVQLIDHRPLERPLYRKGTSTEQLRLNYAVEGFPKTVLDLACRM